MAPARRSLRNAVDNAGTQPTSSVKVKAEQVKKEEVARVGASNDEQPSVDEVGDDDAEGEDAPEEQDDAEGSPRGAKRARVDIEGNSVQGNQDEEEPATIKPRTVTLPRDEDGFIPGSIVRIQLRNFVTYDWVEFRPGPFLNMILGPNGTGKSSIACAICLGLNWPPSVLGRASEINSFVKNNTDDGHIEIELKGKKGESNLIIRRNLSAKSKSSNFTLNGQVATGKEITNRMAELNVQVGNLCSFLPQDKVSEFAAMSPQQLLRETQRAAGDANLTSWHDTLIRSGKDLKQLQERLTSDRAHLHTLEERNAALERDVKRFNDRRRIEHQIALLKLLIPTQEYRESRARYMEIKIQQRAIHEKVATLQKKNAPIHKQLEKLARQHKEYADTREDMKKASKQKFDRMKAKWGQSQKVDAEAEEVLDKLQNIKKEEKARVKKIKTLETEIAKIKLDLSKPVETENMDDLNAELRQLNVEHHDTVDRQTSLQERQKAHIDQRSKHNTEIAARMQELRNLDDENVRKLQDLSKWDRECHDAIHWLRKPENQEKFRMPVIEPPCITLTVPDKRYTNAIEACFNANQLKTFVTQCREDYKTLNRCINDEEGLGRKARINTWYREKDERLAGVPPLSPAEMASLNFDDYAINQIACPDGLLWFLKRDLQLHRTAIGLDGSKINVTQSMEAVSRLGPNGEGGGANFVAGNAFHGVQRSRYGRRLAQNMTREVRPARNLVNTTVDPEIKKQIDDRIAQARQALELLDEESARLTTEEAAIKAEEEKFQKASDAIKARKKKVTDAAARHSTLTGKLARAEDRLDKALKAPSANEERAQLKKRLLDMSKKRVRIAKEYADLVRDCIKDQVETTRVGINYLQVGANKAVLEALSQERDTEYRDALAEFKRIDQEFVTIKERSKTILEKSRKMVFNSEAELKADYEAIHQARLAYDAALKESEERGTAPPSTEGVEMRTTNELHAELETQEANLELNLNTNPGVVEQYEKRKREIDTLTSTIEASDKRSRKIERVIKNTRGNWEPALEKLVQSIGQRFSRAFDRIRCAGEVRVSQHEEYDKWAIDILVKFRDRENLQLLTGQRQSGGERSLTTILYLMSLTEEARAPFSLVDEINQGMDAKYERNVHNSMVEVTCKEDSTQYFLITPKLLPNLDYHERMKILCVNNGEWLPEERDVGNMMNMIEAVVQRRVRSAAAA